MKSSTIPVKHNLTVAHIISLLIIILTAISAINGIVHFETVYPTNDLQDSFLPNDIVTLILGIPIIILSMLLTASKRAVGLLLWPGALLYGVYNYTAYLFALPFGWAFFMSMIIVMLSIYTIALILGTIDANKMDDKLRDKVPVKFAGIVLTAMGALFVVRAAWMIGVDITNYETAVQPEMAADFLINPVWIIVGIALMLKKKLAYATGLATLFQASMLFIGVIAVLVIQPLVTPTEFVMSDVIFLAVMGLVCIIPFVIFLKGVSRANREANASYE